MKLPKIKKPSKGLPIKSLPIKGIPFKGFTIKNRFLQKNLISLIVIAVLLIGTGTAYGTLNSMDADRGEDPVYGVNMDRYQVLVSGKGYKLSKKQEKDYKLQKKQNEANAAKNNANDPIVMHNSSGSRVFRPGSYNYRTGRTYKVSKNPRLSSNISEQIDGLPSKVKAGDKLTFKVTAYAYPYGTKNAISKDNIKVTVSTGATAKVYKEKSGSVYYEVELKEGKNKITIQATDKKNKKTTKLGPYTVKAGEGTESGDSNTGPNDNPQSQDEPSTNPPKKTVTKTVDLSIGGELVSGSITFEEGKEPSDIDIIKQVGQGKLTVDGSNNITVTSGVSDFTLNDGDSTIQGFFLDEKGYEEINDDNREEYLGWISSKESDVRSHGLGPGHPFSSTKWSYSSSTSGNSVTISLSLDLY